MATVLVATASANANANANPNPNLTLFFPGYAGSLSVAFSAGKGWLRALNRGAGYDLLVGAACALSIYHINTNQGVGAIGN